MNYLKKIRESVAKVTIEDLFEESRLLRKTSEDETILGEGELEIKMKHLFSFVQSMGSNSTILSLLYDLERGESKARNRGPALLYLVSLSIYQTLIKFAFEKEMSSKRLQHVGLRSNFGGHFCAVGHNNPEKERTPIRDMKESSWLNFACEKDPTLQELLGLTPSALHQAVFG